MRDHHCLFTVTLPWNTKWKKKTKQTVQASFYAALLYVKKDEMATVFWCWANLTVRFILFNLPFLGSKGYMLLKMRWPSDKVGGAGWVIWCSSSCSWAQGMSGSNSSLIEVWDDQVVDRAQKLVGNLLHWEMQMPGLEHNYIIRDRGREQLHEQLVLGRGGT